LQQACCCVQSSGRHCARVQGSGLPSRLFTVTAQKKHSVQIRQWNLSVVAEEETRVLVPLQVLVQTRIISRHPHMTRLGTGIGLDSGSPFKHWPVPEQDAYGRDQQQLCG
jgi:hypothetical protein